MGKFRGKLNILVDNITARYSGRQPPRHRAWWKVIYGLTHLTAINRIPITAQSGYRHTIANLQLGSTGYIRTAGKGSFADTTPGFWLGYDGAYKFSLGDSANYIKWNGSALNIKGTLDVEYLSAIATKLGTVHSGTITSSTIKTSQIQIEGTGDDIYFSDSGIHFYDSGSQWLTLYKSSTGYIKIRVGYSGNASQIKSYGILGLTSVSGEVHILDEPCICYTRSFFCSIRSYRWYMFYK